MAEMTAADLVHEIEKMCVVGNFDVREWGERGTPFSNGASRAFDQIYALIHNTRLIEDERLADLTELAVALDSSGARRVRSDYLAHQMCEILAPRIDRLTPVVGVALVSETEAVHDA